MPNIKSAKKRVLVTEVKTLQNRMVKSSLKTAVKKAEPPYTPVCAAAICSRPQ